MSSVTNNLNALFNLFPKVEISRSDSRSNIRTNGGSSRLTNSLLTSRFSSSSSSSSSSVRALFPPNPELTREKIQDVLEAINALEGAEGNHLLQRSLGGLRLKAFTRVEKGILSYRGEERDRTFTLFQELLRKFDIEALLPTGSLRDTARFRGYLEAIDNWDKVNVSGNKSITAEHVRLILESGTRLRLNVAGCVKIEDGVFDVNPSEKSLKKLNLSGCVRLTSKSITHLER